MTCEDAEEPPMLAIRGAERCTSMKAERKGVGRRWIAVRSDNVLNLDPVLLPAITLSSSISAVEGFKTRVSGGWTSVAPMRSSLLVASLGK
jgi:hypothetical protein